MIFVQKYLFIASVQNLRYHRESAMYLLSTAMWN